MIEIEELLTMFEEIEEVDDEELVLSIFSLSTTYYVSPS